MGEDQQRGHHRVGRAPHLGFIGVPFLLLEDGNERRRERTLAEQPTEKIGNREGQRERARHRAVAHEARVSHLAHHTQHARSERGRAHRAGGLEHLRHAPRG